MSSRSPRSRPCSSAIRRWSTSNTPPARSKRARCRRPPSPGSPKSSAALSASRGDAVANLAALLFDVARRLPQQPAVSDERNSWNYGEFAERVARLAGGLRARGLAPGDRVLLSLENCGEFFELLFGCWAAGLCAVPANARLHPREVEYIAENSGARLLVATPGLAEPLGPLAGAVDSLAEVISTRTADYDSLLTSAPPLRPEPGDPTDRAWLFYTSGTTGRPKGAVLSHRNLLFMSQCYYADIDRVDERDAHDVGVIALAHEEQVAVAQHRAFWPAGRP